MKSIHGWQKSCHYGMCGPYSLAVNVIACIRPHLFWIGYFNYQIYSEPLKVRVFTLHICSNLNLSDSIVMGAYPKSHLQRLVTGLQCLKVFQFVCT